MKEHAMERLHHHMMTLFGVGFDQHIGEYWDVLSPYDSKLYYTTVFHLRRMNPLLIEYRSLNRLIELSNQPHPVNALNLQHWNRRVVVVTELLASIHVMEETLSAKGLLTKDFTKSGEGFLSLTTSGCTLPGKTLQKRLQYWVKYVEETSLTIDRRPHSEEYEMGIAFERELKRSGKVTRKTYRIAVTDILNIEEMLSIRYKQLLKDWMRLSVLSLRSGEEMRLIFDDEEWDTLQSKESTYSARQLSYWMDKAGKTIPMEAFDEWYDWET